jgi:glycosyltransferase involved in cell wall biosynthesis
VTILIAARNAAATIERAIASCLGERDAALILIDDGSTDATVQLARAVAASRLRVIAARTPGGVSAARQTGLEAVETDVAAWLDADDEWIPGRLARLTSLLRDGADVATEAIDLHDGPSGAWLRRLTVPDFLQGTRGAVRLFERNFLPGDTQVAFRVSAYRDAGGYDPAVRGPESFDLLLRAIRRGARIAYGTDTGYRMHAYPGSVSRDVERQTAAMATVLRKHTYKDVRERYLACGYDPRVASWGLLSMALFRQDPKSALRFLEEASPKKGDPAIMLEPEGPWPFPEGWRRAFHRGTTLLLAGDRDREAAMELHHAEAIEPTPEGANNLGVALARRGHRKEAAAQFALALDRMPRYHDAAHNAAAKAPSHITTHPLRRAPSRTDYVAPLLKAS